MNVLNRLKTTAEHLYAHAEAKYPDLAEDVFFLRKIDTLLDIVRDLENRFHAVENGFLYAVQFDRNRDTPFEVVNVRTSTVVERYSDREDAKKDAARRNKEHLMKRQTDDAESVTDAELLNHIMRLIELQKSEGKE